jgi:thioredoxin reductase (NADPH)
MNEPFDVIIIGAGPAGLAAAIYTGRARLNTLVLEKGLPGGQILTTDWVENYPGFPDGVAPFDLMADFRKQAEKFGARIETDDAQTLRSQSSGWSVVGGQREYETRSVIIATGANYRKLGVEGEIRLVGKGVSYCATCDAAFFRDRDIVVVGGGDNALKEALFLAKFGKTLKIIHRRDKLRGEKILQERVFAHNKIEIIWDSIIEEIKGEEKLEFLQLKNVKTGFQRDLRADGLFVSIGMVPNSDFVQDIVDCDDWGQIKVDSEMHTRQKGVFAAGDVTNACPEQIATAVGTGVSAAMALNEYLESLENK